MTTKELDSQIKEMKKMLKDMHKDMLKEERQTGEPAMLPGEVFFMITGLLMALVEGLELRLKEAEDVSK